MKYYDETVKNKNTGELRKRVRLVREGEDPTFVLPSEELISSEEISEEQAVKLCGEEAILGREDGKNKE